MTTFFPSYILDPSWPLNMGLIGCSETSVKHYRYSLLNSQVEGSSYTRGGSLKSWLYFWCSVPDHIQLFYMRTGARARAHTHTYTHTHTHTHRRTPLDEWSARHRDLYLTIHNTHNRQTSMPPVGFEPTISADERPKTYALDRAATRENSIPLLSDRSHCH